MREQCPSHALPDRRSPFHRRLPQMEIEEQSTRRKKNSHHYIVCGVVRLAPYDICWFAMDLRRVQLEFRVAAIFFCASGWTTITRLPTKNLAIVWRTHTHPLELVKRAEDLGREMSGEKRSVTPCQIDGRRGGRGRRIIIFIFDITNCESYSLIARRM